MAKTKKEIEEWLKDFSKKQKENYEEGEEWNYETMESTIEPVNDPKSPETFDGWFD